jgi:hypothetical protein
MQNSLRTLPASFGYPTLQRPKGFVNFVPANRQVRMAAKKIGTANMMERPIGFNVPQPNGNQTATKRQRHHLYYPT